MRPGDQGAKRTGPVPSPKGAKRPRRLPAPLTAEKRALAEAYVPLARSIASGYRKLWRSDADEFEAAALTALVEAAHTFDPTRGVKFATFARYRILGSLRDVLRDMILLGYRAADDADDAPRCTTIQYHDEENGTVMHTTRDRPVGQAFESDEFVARCFKNLPPLHAAVCRAIYFEGKSQAETAKVVGVSKSRVSTVHAESITIISRSWDYLQNQRSADRPAGDHSKYSRAR